MGIAPEVFEVREDDFLYILDENPPESMRPTAGAGRRQLPARRDHASRTEPAGGLPRRAAALKDLAYPERGEPMTQVWNTPLTPLAFLRRSAEVFPDKTAVVYGDRRLDYAELAAETTRVAHALRGSGIGRGDRVAYLLPNVPEMLVAHFAVPLAGAVLVAINTRLSTDEVRYILDHSGAKLLVVDAALYPTVAPVAGALKTVEEIITVIDPANPGDGTGSGVTYDDLLARGQRRRRCPGRSPTRTRRSRSTTRPAPPASPRACSTRTAART